MAIKEMTMLCIVENNERPTLSNSQKLFNKLIKQIERERKLLAQWQEIIPRYQQRYAAELLPLIKIFNEHRTQVVFRLDAVYSSERFNKFEKRKLSEIITSITSDLVFENDDETLKKIYGKYSRSDFDSDLAMETDYLKAMMESMLGVNLEDDIDLRSPEKAMAQISEKMLQKIEQENQEKQAFKKRLNKKSAKALAHEEKRQAEAQNISQSIREVYRKLASVLHPDKEQDLAERERKTALMQQVNTAYEKRDLLRLLELQLEVEQIDQAALNTLSEKRLKHYNKILAEQSMELRCELDAIEMMFKTQFNISPEERVSPTNALLNLEADIKRQQADINAIKKDLASFQDIKNIKNWLRTYQWQEREMADLAAFF